MDSREGRILVGEAIESSDEEESQFERVSKSSPNKGLILHGEAPDSDLGEDDSVSSCEGKRSGIVKQVSEGEGRKVLDGSAERLNKLDVLLYKRYLERNQNLRRGLQHNFLEPVIARKTKRLERFSQNLSNSQMDMQEALLQSRIGTGNLLRLQMELNHFKGLDQLRRLKI